MPVVGALAAPELVLVALLGLLLLYATRSLWVPFLIWLLSQIPVIGGFVAAQAARLINDAFNWMGARVRDTVHVLTDAVIRVITRMSASASAVQAALGNALAAIAHLFSVALPALAAWARALVTALQAWTWAQLQRLEGLIDWRIRALAAFLLAWVEATVSAAVANLNQQFRGLEEALGAVWAATTAAIATALGAAQAYTDQRVHQAEVSAATAIGTASADALAAEQALRRQIDAAAASAEAYARSLTLDAERLAGLANARTLATALAATGVVAIGLEAIRELECIKRCAPLGAIGASVEALDLAALLLLVGEAARDPKGTAQFLEATIRPIVDEGVTLSRALTGR